MHVINARNVGEALPLGVAYLLEHGVREESRAGPVLVSPVPVTTVYSHPQERVLLASVRDANPFFHVAEALWLLAGRRDAEFLNNFVREFGERFAEKDGNIHGAYGHRWRHAFGIDQLDAVVETLRRDPTSRQCVIQMWDSTISVRDEYRSGQDDLGIGHDWRDRPCNTHAYLRVREADSGTRLSYPGDPNLMMTVPVLDITVLCRSNDIIWGAYGANAVQFSVLQEYLAARIGVGVGTYYQVSNNYHAYVSELDRLTERANRQTSGRPADGWGLSISLKNFAYDRGDVRPESLVDAHRSFHSEVKWLLRIYEGLGEGPPDASAYALNGNLQNRFLGLTVWPNRFLGLTVWPMLMAHRNWKMKKHDEALRWTELIRASDWQLAAREWLERRIRP